MAFCRRCGREIADSALTCSYCGTPTGVTAQVYQSKPQDDFLSVLQHRLNNERKCWKIGAFVFLGCAILYFILGILGGAAFSLTGDESATVIGAAYATVFCIVSLLCFVPLCIVNFVMAKKAAYYRDCVYSNTNEAVQRCASVGTIVLAGLFNEIALIFVIINFVNCKKYQSRLR